ncbi:hypothetical protein JTE90_002450 [Oedothorax gibbosus]|uniref:Uncharacterized protein n=1 Tax=Oedothorax gibbosus TaxID=931172 RepID=A0AAV6UUW7_9ARAC|nr:hypothetical protein JTE90_002450 [Oedothorax gibbosus]
MRVTSGIPQTVAVFVRAEFQISQVCGFILKCGVLSRSVPSPKLKTVHHGISNLSSTKEPRCDPMFRKVGSFAENGKK